MIAEMLTPPPRLTGANLAELARSIRQRAPEGDVTADSVAAALESVAHRRASGRWARRGRFALSLLRLLVLGQGSPAVRRPVQQVRLVSKAARPQGASAAKSTPRSITPEQVAKALAAAQQGLGVQPDVCETMVKSGWVQWRHGISGEAVDECHPASTLKITPAGALFLRLATERATLKEECLA